jgi:hypothetical protein
MDRTKTLMFSIAGIAAAVLAASIYGQAVASSKEIRDIDIPFSVSIDPENDLDYVEVDKGKALSKKVLVETLSDAEFDLNFEVYPYDENLGAMLEQTAADDKKPDAKLDKVKVKISRESKIVKDLAPGYSLKESGASIVIAVPADTEPGTYTYMLEAKSNPDAEGLVLGSGSLVRVVVK